MNNVTPDGNTPPAWQPPVPILPATPMEMLARAVLNGADPVTMQKLLDMQERWEDREARKAFRTDMALAKAAMPTIYKNREVDHGAGKAKWRYEDLGEIEKTIRPTLSEHGFDYNYSSEAGPTIEDPVKITCHVWHRDGHSHEATLVGKCDTTGAKNAIQALGSVVTYLQRQTLKLALGLSASNDDDGMGGVTSDDFFVTAEQLVELRRAIGEAGQTEARICAHPEVKVASLDKLPRSKFEPTMKKLALNIKAKQ